MLLRIYASWCHLCAYAIICVFYDNFGINPLLILEGTLHLCTKLIQSDSACLASIRTQLLFWCQEMAAYLFKFQPKTLYRFRISSCTPAFSAGLQYSAIQTVGKLRIATLCTSGLYKKVSTTVICDVSLCHLTKLLKCIYQYVCYEYVCIAVCMHVCTLLQEFNTTARASTTSATLS